MSESEAVTVSAGTLGLDAGPNSETAEIAAAGVESGPGSRPDAQPGSHEHVLDVTAAPGGPISLLRSMWAHRHLAFMLARKDFFVRYRRATLGVLWAVGIPFIQAMVLTLVFSVIVKLPAPNHVSRSVFIFSGIVAFTYFNTTVMQASTSIVDGAGMSSRIYFPRAVLPLMSVCANAYALVASTLVLLILAVTLGAPLDEHVLLLPAAILLVVVFTLSLALVLSALHVYFRDIRYIVQATLLALFYVTPIFYSLSRPAHAGQASILQPHGLVRDLILCNPLSGCVEIFRASIGGADKVWPIAVAITLAWTVVLMTLGLVLQSRRDRLFADLL